MGKNYETSPVFAMAHQPSSQVDEQGTVARVAESTQPFYQHCSSSWHGIPWPKGHHLNATEDDYMIITYGLNPKKVTCRYGGNKLCQVVNEAAKATKGALTVEPNVFIQLVYSQGVGC